MLKLHTCLLIASILVLCGFAPLVPGEAKPELPSFADLSEAELVKSTEKMLASTTAWKGVINSLQRTIKGAKDPQEAELAQKLIDRIDAFGKELLAKAQALVPTAPAEADALYKLILKTYAGTAVGDQAVAATKDKGFLTEMKAWELWERIAKTAEGFQKVEGAEASAEDKQFEKVNRARLKTITDSYKVLMIDYAKSVAAAKAAEVIAQYKIAPPTMVEPTGFILKPSEFKLTPNQVINGQQFELSAKVTNSGTGRSGKVIAIFLQQTVAFHGVTGEAVVGVDILPSLGPGESGVATYKCFAPYECWNFNNGTDSWWCTAAGDACFMVRIYDPGTDWGNSMAGTKLIIDALPKKATTGIHPGRGERQSPF